jgi:hypothetical protein
MDIKIDALQGKIYLLRMYRHVMIKAKLVGGPCSFAEAEKASTAICLDESLVRANGYDRSGREAEDTGAI